MKIIQVEWNNTIMRVTYANGAVTETIANHHVVSETVRKAKLLPVGENENGIVFR